MRGKQTTYAKATVVRQRAKAGMKTPVPKPPRMSVGGNSFVPLKRG